MPIPTHPPFVHPRRDPYLARARRLAALFLSLVQAAWFAAFVVLIQSGVPLTFTTGLLGIAGMLLIATRIQSAADISLGLVDRLAGIEYAPARGDILRRFLAELAVPFAILAVGLSLIHRPILVHAALATLVLQELIIRVLRVDHWNRARIDPEVLEALLRESPEAAVNRLAEERRMRPRDLEATALALSGIAIRKSASPLLAGLEKTLESVVATAHAPDPVSERALAVVRADRARLSDPNGASPLEANALRLAPAGHPRRLALALFVSTAALDQDDPQSALKALSLLHSRDVLFPAGRVLVNWLTLQAAQTLQQADLVEACQQALRSFDVRRVVRSISLEATNNSDDAYARWIRRAARELGD